MDRKEVPGRNPQEAWDRQVASHLPQAASGPKDSELDQCSAKRKFTNHDIFAGKKKFNSNFETYMAYSVDAVPGVNKALFQGISKQENFQ